MDRRKAQEVAGFRYGLIAPVVSRRELPRGEQTRILRNIASRSHKIPFSTKDRVSVRTLERYLSAYRERGFEGLLPEPRSVPRRIPEDLLEMAVKLRMENPDRSIERIIGMLEKSGEAPPGLLKRTTLYDRFKSLGLTRTERPAGTFQRYQAKRRNARWMGDSHHLLYLPGPDGRKQKVYLVAWLDDYSRFVPHAEIYRAERLPMLEDCLKKAVVKHGLPEQVHCDNGAMYAAHHFGRILGHLGIELVHSRPYRPAGRGKIEKFFQLVKTGFTSEAYRLLEGRSLSLEELNELFWAWLKTYYHERVHSATKQKPVLRFENDPTPIRRADLEKIYDAFLLETERTVDKTGVFTINQVPYQAELKLAGKKVLLRYDPYNPEKVQVWMGAERFSDAKPLVVPEHTQKTGHKEPERVRTGLNFLEVLAKEHQKDISKARMKYRSLEGTPHGTRS